jgi:hypothetical protein
MASMADVFGSSKHKLNRAKEHFADVQIEIQNFLHINPYERVAEAHPEKADHIVHKIKLTQSLPPAIANITADMVQNLRNALDNAGYAIATAYGKIAPLNTAFPFARSVTDMPKSIGRSKDLPPEIQSLFFGFQPYLGGDDLLWALNEICVADKHKMVLPVGTGALRRSAAVKGTGFFSMPNPHRWDRSKNEMVLLTLGPEAEYDYDFDFHLFVAFNDIQVVDGQPVLGILNELGRKVESILVAIEAEARRLGFVN